MQLSQHYSIVGIDKLLSPCLVVFRDLVERNLDEMVRIAGSVERLRPHCKTHKTHQIVEMQKRIGITRQKCATIAEAEMLAECNVEDIFLAYQPVGPNIERVIRLQDRFPRSRFAVAVDSPVILQQLAEASVANNVQSGVFLELDPGMNRTGIEPGERAFELYEMICTSSGIRPEGLHWYDGHLRQTDLVERKIAFNDAWSKLTRFRDQLMMNGFPIPRIVAGGTGTFPLLAEVEEPNVELSPGTVVYFDAGYREQFPDLKFIPALGILTRVICNNRPGFLTLDLGHKACAADPAAGHRLSFPALPDAVEIQQNEEHLVIQTEQSAEYALGNELIAIPNHACPTSAAYSEAIVVSGSEVIDTWQIAARDRKISI